MNFRLILVAVILLILQAGLGPIITLGDARPSFLLPFVVYVGLREGSLWGTVAGFVLGLSIDSLGQLPLGMSAVALSTAGFFSARLSKDDPFRLWWPWTVLVLLFAILLEVLRMLLLARANSLPFFPVLFSSGLPSAAATTVLAILWFLSPLHSREDSVR
ncbi:MAG: rod shape-determining protein MreD [Calditrichaeota bacterium]|nr:rod shape-determining protein MreD [Calditrichota bacterium]MCB9391624.1 rod shape-determining protein MreD [Calditrichota bacterium]